MRILGMAGLVLALAIVGSLVVSYLQEGHTVQETLRALAGGPGPSQPVDPTKPGLERRLAPVLDQERRRVGETDKILGQ